MWNFLRRAISDAPKANYLSPEASLNTAWCMPGQSLDPISGGDISQGSKARMLEFVCLIVLMGFEVSSYFFELE